MPSVRTGYRVRNLPLETKLTTMKYHLSYDQEKVDFQAKSIARINDEDPDEPMIATLFCRSKDEKSKVVLKTYSGDATEIDQEFWGFTPLNDPEKPIVADIIAVTGLAGNAFGSWASDDEHMWLRDTLAKDFPSTRIMIWGYDSRVKDSQSDAVLSGFGEQLAYDLNDVRARTPNRLLILIGHCMGGLIIQEALLRLHQQGIHPPIPRLVFFGVPHRGVELEALKQLVGTSPPATLVGQLSSKTPQYLNSLRDRFINCFVSNNKNTVLLSLYEEERSQQVREVQTAGGLVWERTGHHIMMVSKESATLDLPNWQEIKLPVNANHSKMAKLSPSDASVYSRIKAEMRKGLEYTPEAQQGLTAALNMQNLECTSRPGQLNSNINNQDQETLALAIEKGSYEVVNDLLRAGVDLNARNKDGRTPLLIAVRLPKPSLDIVKLLVQNNAIVDVRDPTYGCTPPHCASTLPTAEHTKILRFFLESGGQARVNDADNRGLTPLYSAARQHCYMNVQTLLDHGAEINSCNWLSTNKEVGETPLMAAAYADPAGSFSNPEVLDLLLKRGANIHCQTKYQDKTALMIACYRGYTQGVKVLLKNGAKPGDHCRDGCTAMIYAAKVGHVDIMEMLQRKGNVNIDAVCNQGRRALDWAIYFGRLSAVEFLLQADKAYRPKNMLFADNVERDVRQAIEESVLAAASEKALFSWKK